MIVLQHDACLHFLSLYCLFTICLFVLHIFSTVIQHCVILLPLQSVYHFPNNTLSRSSVFSVSLMFVCTFHAILCVNFL